MKKELSFMMSTLPILALIFAAACSIFIWDAGMQIPLVIGVSVAALIAKLGGWKWSEIERMMIDGVARALPAVFILLLIGMIVGTWIASGVIPTLIYYGLSLIKPELFIPLVALITGIVSVTLGSSFTSIATIGLAFMAIGEGLGFTPGLVVGAIISGAFFGDKISPLSDTTNIAPAMAETDLFSHIKHMLWDTIPAFIIALILYGFAGQAEMTNQVSNMENIELIKNTLDNIFIIHPLLLVVPIFTIFLMLRRVPAIPALTIVGLLGAVVGIFVQGTSISSMTQIMTDGFSVDSGIEAVDSLLDKRGIMSMLETIALLMIATALGGILEETGAFEIITRKMMAKIQTIGALIAATLFFTFIVAFASGAQFLAIILPARTFVQKYKDMGIDTKNLSRCVEAAGTVGINLVPWGVPAVFAANTLGVSPSEFIPYAFFVFLVPLINLLFGFTGWTITKEGEQKEDVLEEGMTV